MDRSGYKPQLDVLRAIAVGMVLVEHFGGPFARANFPIGPGALGVHLFFVLSGFLITRNFMNRLDRMPSQQVIKHFYITRFARLMPAYYLTLLVTFLFAVPQVRDFIWWHVAYVSNYLAASGGPLTIFWTLAVEEQFYLLLPFLILGFRRNAVLVAAFLIGVGLLTRVAVLGIPLGATTDGRFAFEVTLLGSFEILGIGVLIGALTHDGRRLLGSWLTSAAIACLVFQTVLWYFWGQSGIMRHLTFNVMMGVFFAWTVLIADRNTGGILAWLGSFALIRFIGKISYGIYLMHWFFPLIFDSQWVISRVGHVPLPVEGVICLLLSFIVPAASWVLIEAPVLRMKDWLLARRVSANTTSERAPTTERGTQIANSRV